MATLAVCLAANAVIFAIVSAVLLRPLPFPQPDRIVTMYNAYPGAGALRGSNGVPDYYDRLRETDVFEEIAVYRRTGTTIGGQDHGQVERIAAMQVSPSFFRLLRETAYRGRLFKAEEAEVGHDKKVILSYGAWQRLFAGRDTAVGRTLRINAVLHDIVGVLPPGFRFVDPDVQIWTVVAFTAEERSDARRHSNNWQMIARLRPGVTVTQAQQQIDALNTRNLERFPQFKQILINAGFHTPVLSFKDEIVSEAKGALYLLWGGVALVLLIGCVNVTNLASVRATIRTRELVTRVALGASTGRLARQVLTESILLSAIGGAAGLALAWWALRAVTFLGLDHLPRGSEIALDGSVLGYMLALVTAVGMLVGVLPVLALRRANLGQVMREEGRSGTASRGARVGRRLLVTSQVAFALMLLVGAGLLLASFRHVLAVDTGFRAEGVLTGKIGLPAARYAKDEDIMSAHDRLLTVLRTLPGVQAVGLTSTIPFGDDYSDSVILVEGYQMKPGESLISPSMLRVSDGYFEAMGIRLLGGRFFNASDTPAAPRAVIVDRQLANRFWPNQDPIGKRMYLPVGHEGRPEAAARRRVPARRGGRGRGEAPIADRRRDIGDLRCLLPSSPPVSGSHSLHDPANAAGAGAARLRGTLPRDRDRRRTAVLRRAPDDRPG